MAYIVNKTDGTAVTTIVDGTIDNTTSLTLFGKSYSGFGELLNEDLVRLLENSASTSSPVAPLRGELWFDTTVNQLKIYDGSSFKPTGGAKAQATAPSSPSAGDLWVNSTDAQLYFYTGSAWQLAGPVYTAGQTLSGFKIETINDDSAISRVIASMYSGNTRVAILSANGFTPGSPITGFAQIYAGLTLNSAIGAQFVGTTTTAQYLNISGTTNSSGTVIAGGNFMRKDAAQTTTGAITVASDTGVLIGAGSDLQLTVSGGINSNITNVSENGNLSIKVNNNGSTVEAIKIDAANARVGIFTASPTVPLEITGDVKITGNLNVSGEYTSTTSALMNDTFIKLNNGNNSNLDSGIRIDRDASKEAKLYWNASAGYWVAGKSESGTYSQIIRYEDTVIDGDANKGKILRTDESTGNIKLTSLTLGAVGSNIATADTSNLNVPTTGQVAESIKRWGGSYVTPDDGSTGNTVAGNRYVETVAPLDTQGADGDLWFVREA